jgi:imidazole glycerol-phosphate synthase subunit HisH
MLAIINYGVGNLTSILNMHKRLGIEACITSEESLINSADRLLLPGVGHFDNCMKKFNASGLRPIVEKRVLEDNVPVLGICVGAQMMTRGSEEGEEKGLGWMNADTVRFQLPAGTDLKVPHMGWADLHFAGDSLLWKNMPVESRFYFAHSYHFKFDSDEMVTGTVNHGLVFPCAFRKSNIYGVQFHPEKSHKFGMKLFENFSKNEA